MAKREDRRWTNLRTAGEGVAPISGSKPTKRPGTRRKKRDKVNPWYWVKNRKAGRCGLCEDETVVGQIIAFSRPNKIRCGRCVRKTGLNVKTSAKLAAERQAEGKP